MSTGPQSIPLCVTGMAAVVTATEKKLASSAFIHAFVCELYLATTDMWLCESQVLCVIMTWYCFAILTQLTVILSLFDLSVTLHVL